MENKNEERGGWHYSSDTNSTKFSNCCDSALTGGGYCPNCDKKCN